ncbi:MAG: hypothetical protein Q8N23_32230 [Archangium sp.]|nr:hypothetical protein [Archangium sp.]MDP3157381.1 hypothetical protein [Archangium sp.]MDP3571219.1 hypothetical protein [Archangium sp.]
MKTRFATLLLALSACSDSYFTTTSLELVAGGRGSMGIVSTAQPDPEALETPLLSLEPVADETGLTVFLGLTPPNPRNIRGVLSVRAAVTAPLGSTLITVKSKQGSATLQVNVKPAPTLSLVRGLGQRRSIAGYGDVLDFVAWVKNDGTVMQRSGGVTTPVTGLSDIKTIAAGYAVTNDGRLYSWLNSPAPVLVREGVVDVNTDYGPALALLDDGRVIDVVKGEALADVSDVVAMRVSGFSQFVGGGAQYSRTNRYFLKTDGTVLLQDLVEYISPPPVPAPTLTTTLFAAGVKDVTSAGFAQSPDGQVLYNGLLVHDFEAKKIASTPRVAFQMNASTLSTSRTGLALFADGALWASSVSSTSGSNQQGAPTFTQNATQRPLRAPNDAPIEDFEVVGPGVLVFTREGVFITDGSGGFVAADFPDLRR